MRKPRGPRKPKVEDAASVAPKPEELEQPGQPQAPEEPEDDAQPKHKKTDYGMANVIVKMMYVSGETAEPSAETTGMVEEIVRQQVIEMVSLDPPPTV